MPCVTWTHDDVPNMCWGKIMPELTLFHAVGACSEVTLCALRRTGLAHRVEYVDLARGEQASPVYLAINPAGKVPALLVDGRPLTENPVILLYLDRLAPDAALLPKPQDFFDQARIASDLVWCGSTLHPLARAIYNPARVTAGETAGVREKALGALRPMALLCEERFARQPCWYGDSWTIADRYLGWIFRLAEKGGFPLGDFDRLARRVRTEEAS